MDDNDVIRFISLEEGDEKKIAFASYLKKDYVAKSMVIYLDRSDIITHIYFSSNDYGSVEWKNGVGLTDCHRWESEDQAKSPTYLTRRYTAILSDGAEHADYAKRFILPDVIEHLGDNDLADLVSDILHAREYLVPFDYRRFTK